MALVKHKSLDLGHIEDFAKADKYVDHLVDLPGVLKVSLDSHHGKIDLSYDLEKINFKTIIKALTTVGYNAPTSIWTRLKRGWVFYTEENELDNYNTPAQPCCSHPDEILEKSKKHVHP